MGCAFSTVPSAQSTAPTIYDNAGWGIYSNSTSLSTANGILDVHNNTSGGLYISGTGPFWLQHCVIRDNDGHGIEVRGAGVDLYVVDSLVLGNIAAHGGGIYVYASTLTVSHTWVIGNSASGSTDGGGIYCGTGSTCQIQHNVISDNSAGDQGGGIHVYGGELALPHEIMNNIFTGNEAASGGGLAVIAGTVMAVVTNNTFLDNRVTGMVLPYCHPRHCHHEQYILHNSAGYGSGRHLCQEPPCDNL